MKYKLKFFVYISYTGATYEFEIIQHNGKIFAGF